MLAGVGGGFLDAGVTGEYFNNTALTGSPSFTRRDDRIDFDWGTNIRPGGSSSDAFSAIGTDSYSVRWTGQLKSRFNETYTFRTTTDDGVRLFIKPTTSSTWTTLIDQWVGQSATEWTGSFALNTNTTYDLRME